MNNYTITSIPTQCLLGESPFWHVSRQSFFWVDIENGKLFEHHLATGKTNTKSFPHRLTLILEGEGGELILALDRKIASYDLDTEVLTWQTEVESDLPLNRFNDGKCDAKGRLWIGTMSTKFTEGSGSLYRVGKDLIPEMQLDQLTISNGMAWTADNQTFYFIDTPTRKIKSYHFELEKGEIKYDRVAIEIPDDLGFPDGMCIDQEGMLWVAHYGGSGVYRWNPTTGKLLEKIDLPVPHITSCAFGGENLDTLLITSAQENMSSDQLKEYPLSGDVFLVKTETRGYEADRFII
ncbi:sugar lactone lactonase YvrE [Algoriphagus ratkowskyi]|uniref:SMP-30/gluconolactonase/LRE family protein n=1 Tax=Algoriphagus ratkowskyi TaxID=57028 RepID=A0A2W7R1P7_9BACT|nr:SMP-30/gluconolactonase/LRE family protein [Algoriphagus ratkowskyi]PZX54688.1 sugar lactone lactonase YvrE [Algoriphagus ratkowskyi]TXD77000.1 SMP-30/gluconolactonase/LRE family protein [Algoriphagus ratkowskyi]